MTATPDRPATTPEGAGLAADRREELGRLVRDEWVAWAHEQPTPKASWLLPWEALSEPDREVDRRIGERLYAAGLSERTEGAGEVALSEEEWAPIWRALRACKAWDDAPVPLLHQNDERHVRHTITPAILARRALPTAGRVVEVERVAEQVEAAAGELLAATQEGQGRVIDHWRGPDYVDGFDAGLEASVARLRALAAAIRAGEEGGKHG